MFTHPLFQKIRVVDIPLDADLIIMEEKWIADYEREWIRVFDGEGSADPYTVGFVTRVAARSIGEGWMELSWYVINDAELDLLIVRGSLRLGFEVKRTVTPTLTPSMRSALHDLKLKSLTVVHAGNATFPLSKHVQAVAVDDLLKIVKLLR
jgi:hypothetical protein